MIQTIYTKLPREKISHLTRAEFINGNEQSFHDTLKASMLQYGFKDPVYIVYHHKQWGDKLKVIVGNNRMVIAKELNIQTIPAIITHFKAQEYPLKGKVLTTDDEIRSLFHLPKQLHIRRDKNGDIDQVTPPHFPTVKQHYV